LIDRHPQPGSLPLLLSIGPPEKQVALLARAVLRVDLHEGVLLTDFLDVAKFEGSHEFCRQSDNDVTPLRYRQFLEHCAVHLRVAALGKGRAIMLHGPLYGVQTRTGSVQNKGGGSYNPIWPFMMTLYPPLIINDRAALL
jgi:hypothetical protein